MLQVGQTHFTCILFDLKWDRPVKHEKRVQLVTVDTFHPNHMQKFLFYCFYILHRLTVLDLFPHGQLIKNQSWNQ